MYIITASNVLGLSSTIPRRRNDYKHVARRASERSNNTSHFADTTRFFLFYQQR
jgi:hypothetical protein